LSIFYLVAFSVIQTPAQENSTDQHKLEAITVTAEKREENIQKVPISMDAFSGIQLEDAGINDLAELTKYSPNLFSTPSLDNKTVVIRGVSTINAALSPPAGLFVDDISYPLNRMQNPELLDIERIEVLRGPQGTLYGKNTESGAINIVTRQPGNRLTGKVFGEYGFFDTSRENTASYKTGGNISGPIQKDKLFMGLAFQAENSDGYMVNLHNGNEKAGEIDRKSGRISLRWTPVEKWDIALVTNLYDKNDGMGYLRYENGKGESDRYEIDWNGGNVWKEESNGQVIRAKYSGETFDVLSITGRSDHKTTLINDADFGPFDFQNQDFLFDNTTWTQEIRLSSVDNTKLKWVCGLFGSKDETNANSETPAYRWLRNTEIKSDSIATFGQGTYTFFDRLHLTAGLRYEHQESEGRQENNFTEVPRYSSSTSNDEFLPKGSVSFDVNEEVMTYFTVSKGFLSGGYNFHMANNAEDLAFDPEHVINYEAGLKTAFFDNRLIVNAAIFHLDIKDKQVVEWPAGQSPTTRQVTNAADASSEGLELEIKARPMRGLDLFAGVGYTKSKFDHWIADLSTGSTYDYKDKYLPNVPRYTYNAGVQYRNQWGIFMRADVLGTGKLYTDSENTQKVNGYETVNVKLGFEKESYDLSLWCKNIIDEEYVVSRVNYFGSLVQDGAPRSFGVTLTYRF